MKIILIFLSFLFLLLSGCTVVTTNAFPPPLPPVPSVSEIVIAPAFYPRFGYGYWYGGRFWCYRQNFGFCRGRYYPGYIWRRYNGYPHPGCRRYWHPPFCRTVIRL